MPENENNNTEIIKSGEDIEIVESEEIIEETEETEETEIVEQPVEIVETVETEEETKEPEIEPETQVKKSGVPFKDTMLGTTVILGVITVITAFMLALLNHFTAPVIEKRLNEHKEDAVAELFGDGMYPEKLPDGLVGKHEEDIYVKYFLVTEVLLIKNSASDEFAGYCVTVDPKGFVDKIIILVAVNPDITVKDTKIIDISETAGQGTKIDSENWFREQFKYKSKDIKDVTIEPYPGKNEIQVIAGATISSRAFTHGVNEALAAAEEIGRRMNAANGSESTKIQPEEIKETAESIGEGESIDE